MTSTDRTRGLPLAERVEARVAELEQALTDVDPADDRSRGDIELALATAKSLTTGDVSHPSDVVGSQLNEWLERNKHIGIKASTSRPKPAKDATDGANEPAAVENKSVVEADDAEEGDAARAVANARDGADGGKTGKSGAKSSRTE